MNPPITQFASTDVIGPILEPFTTFRNILRAERWPLDNPRTTEDYKLQFANLPKWIALKFWAITAPDSDEILALASAQFQTSTPENAHLVQAQIDVLPDHRQKGYGKALLREIVTFTKAEGRTLIMLAADSLVPAGKAFMEKAGADMGMAAVVNQLDLADVDQDLLTSWETLAQERAKDYALGYWKDAIPEEDLQAYLRLKHVMNTAPTDDLDVEDFQLTEEKLRQIEAYFAATGYTRWTCYARNTVTGEYAGYTEVFIDPKEPHILEQEDTGVDPKFRNLGLGRWLKAAMLSKIIAEHPEIKYVRTGNAGSNAPMLRINKELGFKVYKTQEIFQITVEQAEAYLAK